MTLCGFLKKTLDLEITSSSDSNCYFRMTIDLYSHSKHNLCNCDDFPEKHQTNPRIANASQSDPRESLTLIMHLRHLLIMNAHYVFFGVSECNQIVFMQCQLESLPRQALHERRRNLARRLSALAHLQPQARLP